MEKPYVDISVNSYTSFSYYVLANYNCRELYETNTSKNIHVELLRIIKESLKSKYTTIEDTYDMSSDYESTFTIILAPDVLSAPLSLQDVLSCKINEEIIRYCSPSLKFLIKEKLKNPTFSAQAVAYYTEKYGLKNTLSLVDSSLFKNITFNR